MGMILHHPSVLLNKQNLDLTLLLAVTKLDSQVSSLSTAVLDVSLIGVLLALAVVPSSFPNNNVGIINVINKGEGAGEPSSSC